MDTPSKMVLKSLVLSVSCFLINNDARSFWVTGWLALNLATTVFKTSLQMGGSTFSSKSWLSSS